MHYTHFKTTLSPIVQVSCTMRLTPANQEHENEGAAMLGEVREEDKQQTLTEHPREGSREEVVQDGSSSNTSNL